MIPFFLPDYVCDHSRSIDYFTESVNGPENKFVATKVDKQLAQGGEEVLMGGYPGNLGKSVQGNYYLETNEDSPFGKGKT